MEVIAPIGVRIAQARREKGLTQHQLAAATHFSVSLVRHIEHGTRPASHAFTTAAARELGVQLGWLLGQEQVHRQHHEDDSTVAPALRAAMDAYDDPQLTGDVRPLSDLESVFASAERQWRAGRYDRLTMVLPELLRHLYSHAQDSTPGTERGAYARVARRHLLGGAGRSRALRLHRPDRDGHRAAPGRRGRIR